MYNLYHSDFDYMTDEEFEEFILDKIHYFDDVVRHTPRKKPDRVSLWLDTVNQMTACSYCGVVAGSCLGGKENCPKEDK